jgi:2'-5' RNA ligase
VPTIGVAVAIPEPWASQLQDYRSAIGDVTALQIPTHITLIPPTTVNDLDEIEAHLHEVASQLEPFAVRLRGTGSFRPVSPVIFVALAEGISGCEALADAVRRGPLSIELAFPYHPHVTIAHDLPDAVLDRAFEELALFDCEFVVDRFHLYCHAEGEGWRPTRDFVLPEPLAAPV